MPSELAYSSQFTYILYLNPILSHASATQNEHPSRYEPILAPFAEDNTEVRKGVFENINRHLIVSNEPQ